MAKKTGEARWARAAVNNLKHLLIVSDKCERCKCEPPGGGSLQAHHPYNNYHKPLTVKWLCPKCHAAVGKEERAVVKEGRATMGVGLPPAA